MSKVDLIMQESEKAFKAEVSRSETLTNKAEKYIAAVGLVVGFQLIDLNRLYFGSIWKQGLLDFLPLLAFFTLGAALVFALISRRVLNYLSYPRGETIINELKDNNINEDAAKIKIAKMYLTAHDKNAGINDQRAKYLSIVGVLIVIGFVLAVASHLILKPGI